MGEQTSAKTVPNCKTVSTAFSVDAFINGEYTLNNPSSSWSDKRRDCDYADIYQVPWIRQAQQATNRSVCRKS